MNMLLLEQSPAEVLLLKPIAPVNIKETSTIGVEFIQDKKIVFYSNNDFYECVLGIDTQFTKYNPLLKMTIANFISPCDSDKAISAICPDER